ncbi:MAG: sulfatase modifying factor 1 [Flavobacteriaceae bacterium]|jgi:sulfatase modifying factor 1
MIRIFTLFLGLLFLACSITHKNKGGIQDSPEGMAFIPAGNFVMGGRSAGAYADEFPKHEVSVSAFYIDLHEVSNQEFMAFVEATNYKTIAEQNIDWEAMKKNLPPNTSKPHDSILQAGSLVFNQTDGPVNLQDYAQWWRWTIGANWKQPEGPGSSIANRMNHPVVHIAWEDANIYAKWSNKRLPTEAEWEWAAQGGNPEHIYPWGNTAVEAAFDKANFWQGLFPYNNRQLDGYYGTAPIASYPVNGYGLFDMAGNVWEWCQDRYDFNAYANDAREGQVINPQGPKRYNDPREPLALKHVMRGGSFLCNDSYCSGYRAARRMSSSRDSSFNHTGFRCVKDL